MKKIKIIKLIKNKEFIGYSPIIEAPGMNSVMFFDDKEPMAFCNEKSARKHAEQWIVENSKIQLFMGTRPSGKSYRIEQLLKEVVGHKHYTISERLRCFDWNQTKLFKALVIQEVLTLNELEYIARLKSLSHCLIYVDCLNTNFDVSYLQGLGYEVTIFLNEPTPKQKLLVKFSN